MICKNYDKKIISAGTILYNGIKLPTNKCPPKYKYRHNDTYSNKYILYTADDIDASRGYAASCISNKVGWIRYYRVLNDIELADISADMLHYEVDEVINDFCECNGYYLDWGGDHGKEIVFCDPKDKLEFMGVYKCSGGGKYKNSKECSNNNNNNNNNLQSNNNNNLQSNNNKPNGGGYKKKVAKREVTKKKKVYIGPKGGRYIMVDGNKKYI